MKIIMTMILVLFLAFNARADRVILSNGDSLTGSECTIKDGALILTTGYSDPVTIKLEQVEKVEFSQPVKVTFQDQAVIETDMLEKGAEGFDRIDSANLPPPRNFGINLALGYGVSDGNTNKSSLLAVLDASYLLEKLVRLGFSGRYEYGNDKNPNEAREETANNGAAQVKADFFLIEDGYCYYLSKYSFDRMKDIDRRLENGPGVGYEVLSGAWGYLGLELGSSYIDTRYDTGEKEHGLYLRLGENAQWQLNSVISLTQSLTYQPKAENFNTYLINGDVTLKFSLTNALYLGLILNDRYDSAPVDDKRPNDLSLFASLGYAI